MEIPFIEDACMDHLPKMSIGYDPWPQYPHQVKAAFAIAHRGNEIILKYYIEEAHVRAAAVANGDVHKDSCVELFIAFGDDPDYYNLEFNCIGWSKTGYGPNRDSRTPLSVAAVNAIITTTNIRSRLVERERTFAWELTIVLPAAVFCYHKISSFSGVKAKANFYKCGDDMPAPHFLTWRPVHSATPDFHRREDFADIHFL